MGATTDIPRIDPNVEHVGVSSLRKLDRKRLRNFEDKMLVIQDNHTPVAVLLSYEKYLTIQDRLEAMMDTVELLNDKDELKLLIQGLQEMKELRSKSIADIRRDLKSK